MSDSKSAEDELIAARARTSGLKKILLLSLPAVALTAVAVVAMLVRIPTEFKTDLVTQRLEITPRESLTVEFSGFTALKLEEFQGIAFAPEELGVREEEDQDWKSFEFEPEQARFATEEDLPGSLRLHGGKSGDSVGNLRVVINAGQRVVFSTQAGGKEITVVVRDEQVGARSELEINLFSAKLFRITTHNLIASGMELPLESDVLHYLASVAEHNSGVTFSPNEDALVFSVRPGTGQSKAAFPAAGIPVSAINLLRFNNRDKRYESALVKGGQLARTGVEGEEKFEAQDQLLIGGPENLRVRVGGLDPEAGGLALQLEGKADSLRIASAGGARDYGLTLFERLWRNQQLGVIFGVLFWALSTSFGLYNVYKKFTSAKRD